MNSTHLWIVIIASGTVTFIIRFFFIQLGQNSLPTRWKELLSFIPPTVLSALVSGSIFKNGLTSVTAGNTYLWAALAGLIVAVKFQNTLLTITTGMSFIWLWNLVPSLSH